MVLISALVTSFKEKFYSMTKRFLQNLTLLLSVLITAPVFAGGVYQQPADFIHQVFNDKPPKPSILWLEKDIKKQIAKILGHNYNGLRVRYWQKNKMSAWVLEEIGKEKLITVGIIINNNQIDRVKILAFRESRGWEVRHDFFTDQFKQAKLVSGNNLSQSIDNISGATLSVRAVKKLAKIALLLDLEISKK